MRRGNPSQLWTSNSKSSTHIRGLILAPNQTRHFHQHMLNMNCWPKENRHFRYFGVTWHDLASPSIPISLQAKAECVTKSSFKSWISICKGGNLFSDVLLPWTMLNELCKNCLSQGPDNPNFCQDALEVSVGVGLRVSNYATSPDTNRTTIQHYVPETNVLWHSF